MKRIAIIALLATVIPIGCNDVEERQQPPDVIVILSDTLRSDRLSCYGYERPTSPVLDRIAAEGTLFEDVTAQASWTLPSLVSILQGRYLTSYRETLEPEWPSLAERFRRAGYRTIAVIGNMGVGAHASFRRGFNLFDANPSSRPTNTEVGESRTVGELGLDLVVYLDRAAKQDAQKGPGGKRPPLFLFLHTMDVHMPYEAHPEFNSELPLKGIGNAMPHDWQKAAYEQDGRVAPRSDPNWSKKWRYVNAERARYDQGVRRNDKGLGRILDELKERGFLDNAVLVFLADHGESLWNRVTPNADGKDSGKLAPDEFFYRTHGGTLNEELVRTPLIFWGTGIPAGVRISEPAENVDLFPTLLELCDIPAPPSLHGRSLVSTMRGTQVESPKGVFTFTYNAFAVRERDSGWKFILPTEDQLRFEVKPQLYYLPDDPDERVNLYEDHPEEVARLTQLLSDWRRDHPTKKREGKRDAEQEAALRGLGYTEGDIGR